MCGIAGAVDLSGRREFPPERLLAMTGAIAHRGPDDEQIHLEPGVALGVRRLSVIDVEYGRQPIANETGDVWVAYEGELYNYPTIRPQLIGRGHTLKTSCDTEAWVHLYEDYRESVFDHTHGQYGVALWDRSNRTLLLGRDRIGISPLFYAEADGWLLWGSEIKAILASGMISPQPDPKGIDFFFNFFVLSTTRTCFAGIKSVPPGHFLKIKDGRVARHQYWKLDYPDAGDERQFHRSDDAVDEFEEILRGAVRRRLVGEMPISCYISGGLDSTTILGLSCQEHDEPIPSFTIGLDGSGPRDERRESAESAQLLGSPLTTVSMKSVDIANAYPGLIRVAEGPVLDTSAACMFRLAKTVRDHGCVVSLTGEGSDEALAGYIWFKADQLVRVTGKPINSLLRGLLLSRLGGSKHRPQWAAMAGYRTAQQFSWELMAQSRETLYSDMMWQSLDGYCAYDDLIVNPERFARWHPLNRSLYAASTIMLPGLLLAAKGDRAMRNSATEGRFPFLDEQVIEFCRNLPPTYKLWLWTDKWLLRRLAPRVLPRAIAYRPKTMFRANLSGTFLGPNRPSWVDQLLSPHSLQQAGLFDPAAVYAARDAQARLPRQSLRRFSLDMGLTGVIATQLWHHTFFGSGLADLPIWSEPSSGRLDTSTVIRVSTTQQGSSVEHSESERRV